MTSLLIFVMFALLFQYLQLLCIRLTSGNHGRTSGKEHVVNELMTGIVILVHKTLLRLSYYVCRTMIVVLRLT